MFVDYLNIIWFISLTCSIIYYEDYSQLILFSLSSSFYLITYGFYKGLFEKKFSPRINFFILFILLIIHISFIFIYEFISYFKHPSSFADNMTLCLPACIFVRDFIKTSMKLTLVNVDQINYNSDLLEDDSIFIDVISSDINNIKSIKSTEEI